MLNPWAHFPSPLVLITALFSSGASLGLLFAQPAIVQRYAVLVGINRYQHEKLPPLKFAEADVIETAELLRKAGYQVTLLTGSAKEEGSQPTRANIEQQLRTILGKCRKGDTVLIGFAGHGLQFVGQKDCFFCPADARPLANQTDTLVSPNKVYEELDASFAGMKVLLVDACRDDPMSDRSSRGIDADTAPRPPTGVAALFSCRAGERAFEHEKLGHGVFFYHILQGLKGEAADKRGRVTFAGLAGYVSPAVAEDAPKLIGGGAKQSPSLRADYSAEPVLLVTGSGTDTAKINDSEEITIDLGDRIKMELVRIPAGKFTMGSPASETGRDTHEVSHEVEITKSFYLGKYEVTQEQYKQLMNSNPSWFAATGVTGDRVKGLDTRRFPVENVSWDDAKEFCRKLAKKDRSGRTYRLPTEAEWEYACRAGRTTPFSFGTTLNGNQANCYSTDQKGPYLNRTCRVGSYQANDFGLYDMHGNVWEWCEDWFADYDLEERTNPKGPTTGQYRVMRGGSWGNSTSLCRAAYRYGVVPSPPNIIVGFRVALRLD